MCEIGITRTDFDLKERGVRIEPYALIMGGTASDTTDNYLNSGCDMNETMGEKCKMITKRGDIEAVRFSGYYEKDSQGNSLLNKPILEYFKIDSIIDENGIFFYRIPMNLKYITTNEYGEIVESKDPKVGIATAGNYRFRFSLNDDSGGERNIYNASFLVPNIREYHIGDTGFTGSVTTINKKSYAFSTNLSDYPTEALGDITGTSSDAISDGKVGIPQDYFYQFRYSRVYSVSQFINRYYSYRTTQATGFLNLFRKSRLLGFLGIKDIFQPKENDCTNTNNYFPITDAVRKQRFSLFISSMISYVSFSSLYWRSEEHTSELQSH